MTTLLNVVFLMTLLLSFTIHGTVARRQQLTQLNLKVTKKSKTPFLNRSELPKKIKISLELKGNNSLEYWRTMKRSVAERYCNDFANFEDTLRDAKVKGRPSQVIGLFQAAGCKGPKNAERTLHVSIPSLRAEDSHAVVHCPNKFKECDIYLAKDASVKARKQPCIGPVFGCNLPIGSRCAADAECESDNCEKATVIPLIATESTGTCQESCFPADAIVVTKQGPRQMKDLRLGDHVLTYNREGSPVYEAVYMFGHKDADTWKTFVSIQLADFNTIRLTADHYIPVIRGGKNMEIPSRNVLVGDNLLVPNGSLQANVSAVVSVNQVVDKGLYNPYTLGGRIVVDGILASCHSSSALDMVFHILGVSLPVGYQAVFAPVRFLYRVLGAERFQRVEFVIDVIAQSCNHGLLFKILPGAGVAILIASVTLRS